MLKEEAKKIIIDTFENPFDKSRFSYFARNLLKNGFEAKEFIRPRNYIKTAFKDRIRKFERIGKYTDNSKNVIDVLTVELIHPDSVEQARTLQRNFIRWYLNGSMGDQLKDAALAAFYHPDLTDWRFSFVKMQYSLDKKKDEFTPAKRYSYLVGKSEHSHTAQIQLIDLLKSSDSPSLEQIENAFSIEKVTKRFFDEYKELFLVLKETIDKTLLKDNSVKAEFETKKIDTTALAKKTLGQIVFLYFLQKKGWLGVPLEKSYGQGRRFLQSLFDICHKKGQNFFNDYLKYLFYDALAIERQATDKTEKDFYPRFGCKIPFLNGGLFEPVNDYNWQKINLQIPDSLFYNSTLFGDGEQGTGILNVFDRYNFTVKEDEPLEKEVAVDPEMLGKVFENLLEVNDRKAKGAFYTPREIVHYMCQESLINHLDTKLNPVIPKQDIEIFIRKGIFLIDNDIAAENRLAKNISYQIPESIRKNIKQLDNILGNILICDPAIGSGAFPVGLMTEIVTARFILYKLMNPHKADNHDENQDIVYNLKRHCIQHSVYGVDIDNSAIDIAKLRLWLSLVVDEHDYTKIKPLPNLDYKIVCGNTLLGIEHDLFNNEKILLLEKKKDDFFNCTDRKQKNDLKKEIEKLFDEVTKKKFEFKINFSEVFRIKQGFDIVIGNPPYVRQEKIRDLKPGLKKAYKVYNGTSDIYTYFYESGYNLLKNNGVLTFITSNKWMRAKYGENLRRFFLDNVSLIEIIDFGGKQVFDATVDTNILLFRKEKSEDNHLIRIKKSLNSDSSDLYDSSDFNQRNQNNQTNQSSDNMPQSSLNANCFTFGNSDIQALKAKIEAKGTPLKDWDVKIYRGIITGFNEAFIIDTETKEQLCRQDPKNAEIIKPILRGRDIHKYCYKWAGLWLLFIPWHFPLHNDNSIQGASDKAEKDFKKQYPAIYEHLLQFKDKLSSRNKAETGIRYEWYALQRCAATYYPEFEKEKIIYADIADKLSFCYEDKGLFLANTAYFITGKQLKYVIAILDGKLTDWYYKLISSQLGSGAIRHFSIFIEQIPIPKISQQAQQPFIMLVDRILKAKQNNLKADTTAFEKQIDRLVYELYGLTEEEIKIVEGEK